MPLRHPFTFIPRLPLLTTICRRELIAPQQRRDNLPNTDRSQISSHTLPVTRTEMEQTMRIRSVRLEPAARSENAVVGAE